MAELTISAADIASALKTNLEGFEPSVEARTVGRVASVGDGIARIYGCEKVMFGELLEFPGGVFGLAMNLEEHSVGVVLLGDDRAIKEGDEVRRTARIMSIPIGPELVGRVVNAIGEPIDGKGAIPTKKFGEVG